MEKIDGKTHLLRLDGRLFKRIVRIQKKHRQYLRSRNYFIIELIEAGLDQIDLEIKPQSLSN